MWGPSGLNSWAPAQVTQEEVDSMRERKVWTLVALAGLAALTLVRPERDLDGRPASRPVRMPLERDGIASDGSYTSGGSSAASPPHAGSWLLFRADWSSILWRVYQKMNDNRLLAVAAGVVFYGLLAVFPALTAFVSALRSHGRPFDHPRAPFARDGRSSAGCDEYPR